MRIVTKDSYVRLSLRGSIAEGELSQLRERHKALVARHRKLVDDHHALTLQCGLKGFTVEVKPEVPAKPATLVLRKAAETRTL